MVNTGVQVIDIAAHHVGEIALVTLVSKQRGFGVVLGLIENARIVKCQPARQVLPERVLRVKLTLQAAQGLLSTA